MNYLKDLPDDVARFIRTRFVAEFATVSAAGIPIDTPIVVFPSDDLTTLDIGTGVAYPTKAERARRNPKAGLLLEGGPTEPVVSVAGMAAVRDADLQANLHRYLTEQILANYLNPQFIDYDSITRHAIWYFARIIVCVAPVHIRWWKTPAAMDEAPREWRAPAGATFPKSDPPPRGKPSEAPWAVAPPWREHAQTALKRKGPGHLTLLDAEGYPVPIRVREVQAHQDGFRLTVPRAVPWSKGKATLTFEGIETFVGDVALEGATGLMRVERALPVLPLMADLSEVLQPKPKTKAVFLKRLEDEAARRGQPIPTMPSRPPEPTAGARFRADVANSYGGPSGYSADAAS